MPASYQSADVTHARAGRSVARRIHVAAPDSDQIRNILAAHHAVLASGGARLVQARHWRPVTRVDVGGTEYAVKQYARGSVGARVRRLLRGTRARAAGRRCEVLEALGIAAAPPVG